MTTPKSNLTGNLPAPPLKEEREWLASILGLHPFPALAVETTTGDIIFANETALRLALAPVAKDQPD